MGVREGVIVNGFWMWNGCESLSTTEQARSNYKMAT